MAMSWCMQQQQHVCWADTSCAASGMAPHSCQLLLQGACPSMSACRPCARQFPVVCQKQPSHLYCRNVAKHGRELARMQHPRHRELVCVVEAALAVMRLSCERYFVLLSVLATYLLFRDRVPRLARQLIRLNHQLCRLFQRVSHCLSCCRAYCSQLQPLLLRPGSSQARLTMVPALLQVILLSFPAVCWIYGAGFIFSAFVSVIFWGHHAQVLSCSA